MTIANARPSRGVEIAWPRPVDFRLFNGVIQYRVRGTAAWINIFSLSDLGGINDAIVLAALQGHGFTVDGNGALHLTALEQAVTAVASALAEEANRASGIEAGLRTDLSAEAGRAIAAEAVLRTNLNSEVTRATGIEIGLRSDVDPMKAGDFHGVVLTAKDLKVLGTAPKPRSARVFSFPILDRDGRVLIDLASSRFGGLPRFLGDFVRSLPKRLPRKARRFAAPLISDRNGRTTMWLQPDGLISAVIGGDLAARINENTRARPVDFGFYQGIMNVRVERKFVRCIRQEPDGWSSEIVRRIPQIYPTAAITDHALPIEMYMVIGQSQAGGGDVGPILTDALFPHHVFMFDSNGYAYGDTVLFEPAIRDFVPVSDTWMGGPQYYATMLGFAMERMRRDKGTPGPGYLMTTDWYGGQPLSAFVSGTPNFLNTVSHAKAAVRVAALYQRLVVIRAIFFRQGESGPVGRSTYAAALGPYIDSQVAAVKAAAGGNLAITPHFFFCQINQGDAEAANGVELAQIDVARARLGAGATLIGPMYQWPIKDNIHEDKRMGQPADAELAALVRRMVIDEAKTFNPLWSASATRSGNVITVTYAPVVGGGPLTLDPGGPSVPSLTQNPDPAGGFVLPAPDGMKGYTYTDDSGAPPAITGVAITGDNTVQITLATAPTGANKKLRYGLWQDTVIDTWVGGRGLLYRPTAEPSVYYRLGRAVPPTIRHYACREEIALS